MKIYDLTTASNLDRAMLIPVSLLKQDMKISLGQLMKMVEDGIVLPPSLKAQYSADGTLWHAGLKSSDEWMRLSDDGGATWSDPMPLRGKDGQEGLRNYTWIKFADDEHGSGMSDSPAGKSWLGIAYNKDTAEESDDPADYTWMSVKGDPGRSVTSVVSHYATGNNPMLPPPLAVFVDVPPGKVPVMTATDPVLWRYDTTYFSDGTEEDTVPAVAGVHGDKGESPTIKWDGTKLKINDFDAVDLRGLSAYEVYRKADPSSMLTESEWVASLKGDKFKFSDFTADELESLRGPQGVIGPRGPQGIIGPQGNIGPKGEDGETPEIDPKTKRWKIKGTLTDIIAEGKDGHSPVVAINSAHHLTVDGVAVGDSLKGADGTSVTAEWNGKKLVIKHNGIAINDGVDLQGAPGKDGGTPSIDPITKRWVIGGKPTDIIAQGKDGQTWKPQVAANGTLSWTQSSDNTTPTAMNIKGDPGLTYRPVYDPATKKMIFSASSDTSAVVLDNIASVEMVEKLQLASDKDGNFKVVVNGSVTGSDRLIKVTDFTTIKEVDDKVVSTITPVNTNINSHINNTSIHITAFEKARWNQAVDSLANYVTKNTAQDITGVKTFVGEQKFVATGNSYTDPWLGTACAIKVTGKVGVTDSIKAASFVKQGGTSAQFLKADGSVDSHDYATNSDVADLLTCYVSESVLDDYYTKDDAEHMFVTALAVSGNQIAPVIYGMTGKAITVPYATNTHNLYTNGGVADLNITLNRNGVYSWGNTASNSPNSGWGALLQWSNVNNPVGGAAENWVTQLASGTDNNLYYRTRINTGAWSAWGKILTSLNYSSILDSRYYTEAEANARYVTALRVTGDALTYVKNGVGTNVTPPYATESKVLRSHGRLTAVTNTKHGAGLRMYEVYNNGYPTLYGNLIAVQGGTSNGQGELLLGWSGSNSGHASIYYRNQRDNDSAFSAWATILDSVNYGSVLGSVYASTSRVGALESMVSGHTSQIGGLQGSVAAKVSKTGDTMTGALNVPRVNVENMYWDSTGIMPTIAGNNLYTCGKADGRWANVYTTTINVTSTALVANLNADLLDGLQGTSYAYGGRISFLVGSARANITTAQFISKLSALGAFNRPQWSVKCTWSYANNDIITDTGLGNIQLAGAVIEVHSNSANEYTVRITTSPTTTDNCVANAVFIYRNHGSSYAPNWKRLANTSDNVASATKLQTARTLWGQSFDGTNNVSGNMVGVGNITPAARNTLNVGANGTEFAQVWSRTFRSNIADHLYVINDDAAYGINLRIGTTDALTVASNLNVGIGTTTPAYKLDVNGTARAASFVKTGGTSEQALMANGGVRKMAKLRDGGIDNALAIVGTLSPLITEDVLVGWDGSTLSQSGSITEIYTRTSNLAYCNKGAFGDMATKSAADYVTVATAQTISGVKAFTGEIYGKKGLSLMTPARGNILGCIGFNRDTTDGTIANTNFTAFQFTQKGDVLHLELFNKKNNPYLNVGCGITATSFIKSGGTASQVLMADGSVRETLTSSVGTMSGLAIPASSPQNSIVEQWWLMNWDGRFMLTGDDTAYCNLRYCDRGRFGDIVTHSASDYVSGTVFTSTLNNFLSKADAQNLYQPKGNYLTAHQSLANYVTRDTAQTITGNKTFTGLVITKAIQPDASGSYNLGTVGLHWNHVFCRRLYVTSGGSDSLTAANLGAAVGLGWLELRSAGTPYIDLTGGNSTADYNVRLAYQNSQLEVLGSHLSVANTLRCKAYVAMIFDAIGSDTKANTYGVMVYKRGTYFNFVKTVKGAPDTISSSHGGSLMEFNLATNATSFAGVVTASNISTSSDARLKTRVDDIALTVADIAAAPLWRYRWKDTGAVDVGSTAQYWGAILPELTHTDQQGWMSLDYGKTALLASVSLARTADDHETRIAALEAENTLLRDEIARLRAA